MTKGLTRNSKKKQSDGSFLTQELVLKLAASMLIDTTEYWITGNNYNRNGTESKKDLRVYSRFCRKL